MRHHTWLFSPRVAGMGLRSPCFQGKHLADWAICSISGTKWLSINASPGLCCLGGPWRVKTGNHRGALFYAVCSLFLCVVKTPFLIPLQGKRPILGRLGSSDPWDDGRVKKRHGMLSGSSVSQLPSLRPLGGHHTPASCPRGTTCPVKTRGEILPHVLLRNTSITQEALETL